MKNISTLLLLCFLGTAGFAQSPMLDWALKNDETSTGNYCASHAIGMDTLGNIYYTGDFNGTIDFDPGPGINNITSAGTSSNIFIQKLSASGNLIWIKTVGSVSGLSISSLEMAVSHNGTSTIAGTFKGTIDFDPSPSTFNLVSGSSSFDDVFILQLTNNGDLIYAKKIGSSSNHYISPYDIKVDAAQNVYVAGINESTIDFDPSAAVYNLTPAGFMDGFILKLNNIGDFVWANNIGSVNDNDYISGVAVDNSGNVVLAGKFGTIADFDPSASSYTLDAVTGNGFIMELNSTGNFVWAKNYGNLYANTIKISNAGNIYCGGTLAPDGNPDADPGPTAYNLNLYGQIDAYVQKLSSTGNFIWAISLGGVEYDACTDLEVDNAENVIYTGYHINNTDFDPGSGVHTIASVPLHYSNTYIASLNSSGQFRYAKTFLGVPDDSFGNNPCGVEIDGNNNIFLSGSLGDSTDFDLHPTNTYYLSSMEYTSMYLVKLKSCLPALSVISASGCHSYTSPSGNYTWTTSGAYTDTIANHNGCDSILTINLTITNIDTSITISNGIFTVAQTGAAYQWGDCNSGLPISGANNQNFTPTTNGSYATVVTLNGCIDTSSCYSITDVGLEEFTTTLISIYPNPVSDILSISSSVNILDISILDISGKIILTYPQLDKKEIQLHLSQLLKGVYLITFKIDGQLTSRRFIKN